MQGDTTRIVEFVLPLQYPWSPGAIAPGPDGALWFDENKFNRYGQAVAGEIGRITVDGKVSFFSLENYGRTSGSITPGPDGAMWFTQSDARHIGRITTTGMVTSFRIPQSYLSNPQSLVAGPDGALWFTAGGGIGRITTDGTVTGYECSGCYPNELTFGPDGALWFTGGLTATVYRFSSGIFTQFAVPTKYPLGAITNGPGDELWLANYVADDLMTITVHGVVATHEFKTLKYHNPSSLITDPDGSLWFTYPSFGGVQDYVERYDPAEHKSDLYKAPSQYAGVQGLTIGPHGDIWFTEGYAGKIGRIDTQTR
ncbi:MAG: Virginiamycin B lyase [Candidatus Eremiobacteraeota bacterium]|nr:Virginiamycin B lyase [Candidatus Eremiobacteraeota bacterium]